MDLLTGLSLIVGAIVVLALCYQWVLDAPLFELGEMSWFPGRGDLSASKAFVRTGVGGLVPLGAMIVVTVCILTTPFRIWIWVVVGAFAATVMLSPVLAVHQYDVRPLRPAEIERLGESPAGVGGEILVVMDSRDGPVNGYAIGGPFRDVVGVSEFALTYLSAQQITALLAHEWCHHEQRHVLLRGGVSVGVLGTSAACMTIIFDGLSLLATLWLSLTIVIERLAAYRTMRWLEYRADSVAAQRTSVDAVESLLTSLDEATAVDQREISWPLQLFSTHPSYADRIAQLRDRQPRAIETAAES